jgi:hypothetical protein
MVGLSRLSPIRPSGRLGACIRNAAYTHGTPADDVFESASERHGADGIDTRA